MNSSTHEYDIISENSDNLSISLKRENASSYGGIHSNWNEDYSLTDPSSKNKSKKFLRKYLYEKDFYIFKKKRIHRGI